MNKPELIIDGVSSLKAILEKNEIEYDIEPKISIFIHILKKVKDLSHQHLYLLLHLMQGLLFL